LNKIFISPNSSKAAEVLVASGCYMLDLKRPKTDWFLWKSGITAPCYCNCRNLISQPLYRKAIADLFIETISVNFPDADLIAGIATAGIPWATLVAHTEYLPMAYIRTEKKPHGLGALIEGSIKPESKILFIDDLVASGDSIKLAIDTVLADKKDCSIYGIISIVNWQFERMHSNFSGYNVSCLASYEQILSYLRSCERITQKEYNALLCFYSDPRAYSWEDLYG
jgi:orotate phosphoribosyltransferase